MIASKSLVTLSRWGCRNIFVSASKFDLEVPASKPIKNTEFIDADKERLKWRTQPFEKPGEWYSKLKLFAPDEDTGPNTMAALQQPLPDTLKGLKKWWKLKQEKQERFMQQFIQARHTILGNDLAAAHFLIYRGGRVKFYGTDTWVTRNEDDEYDLPSHFVPTMLIEAAKCDNMVLYYEGLENIRRLKKLKYISFRNVKTFDDWCLDRVSGSEFEVLETLDLTGTNITDKGLHALYRIPSLTMLIVDEPKRNAAWELTLAMLQDIIPNLEIVDGKDV